MPSLLVVNYPTICKKDFEWIQQIRREHDLLNFKAIDPHFTLVFPIADLDYPGRAATREQLVNHIDRSIRYIEPFEFVIRCAVLSNDAFGTYTHVFLVPDEGHSNIIKLHDRLYTGAIESELCLDISFIPHIGIGNSPDAHSCKDLIDRLNADLFEIRGRVERLDLIWNDRDMVRTISSFDLG